MPPVVQTYKEGSRERKNKNSKNSEISLAKAIFRSVQTPNVKKWSIEQEVVHT